MSQKKAKFNIVDILVLLVLIAGVAFVAVRVFGGQTGSADDGTATATYRVTFRADAAPQAVADALELGVRAESDDAGADLGTLVDLRVGEAVVYNVDAQGQTVTSGKPGWVSLELVCDLTGLQEPTGLRAGKLLLNVGHGMTIRVGNAEVAVIITDIQPVSGR